MVRNAGQDSKRIQNIGSLQRKQKNNGKSCLPCMWVAQITFKGKNYNLGRYNNKEDAREAREKAEKEMFGKFLEEHKEYVKDKKDKKN